MAAATPTGRDGVLGALTTPFLAPEWCSRSFTVHPPHQDGAVTWGTRYLDSPTTRSCYPPGFETFNWGEFYSPAVCPSGWTSAGTWKDYGTRKILDYTPLPGEAAIYCCPSEYTYWDFIEVCTSTIGAGSHRPTVTIVDGPPTDNPASDALTSYTTTGPFSLGGHAMYAVPTAIQVRFQASDTSLLGLTGFPTTGTASPTPGPNGASQSTSSSSTAAEAAGTDAKTDAKTDAISNAQLSTGAKAGIGAGTALGAILLAVAAFFVFRRRRQQSLARVAADPSLKHDAILAEKGDDRPPELSDSASEKPPGAHTTVQNGHWQAALPPQAAHELESGITLSPSSRQPHNYNYTSQTLVSPQSATPHELDGAQSRSEMGWENTPDKPDSPETPIMPGENLRNREWK